MNEMNELTTNDLIKSALLGFFMGGIVITVIAVNISRTQFNTIDITIQADRACRPGIYKRILETDNRVICVGGENEEWIVPLKKETNERKMY